MTGRRPSVIRTDGLTKRFGRITAVDDLDLDVREGDVYGFLGANGSGKTTTVRMLLGLVLATSGRIEVLGEPMPAAGRRVLPQVGALVEGPAAYPHLSGRRNLALFDAMGPGGGRADRTARHRRGARAGRAGRRGRPAGARVLARACASGSGWPARCCAGRGCWSSTSRPTASTRRASSEIRELLLDLNRAGTTVFLSSHLLAEIEQMCTRVGVLDRGRLVLQDELAELQRPTGRVEVHTPDVDAVRAAARRRGRGVRRRAAAGPRRRPGRAQRPAGRRGRAGDHARRRAAHASRTSCWRRPAPSADRFGVTARSDPRRAGQAGPQPPHLGDDRADRRAADAGRGAARGHRPRPAAGHRPGVPVRGADRRHAVPARRARHRAAAVPADRGGGHRRRGDRGRGAAGHPALHADPAGRPHPAAGRQAGRGHGVRGADRRSSSP